MIIYDNYNDILKNAKCQIDTLTMGLTMESERNYR
jgi:hypothetical protein